jgi:hypothetical protein
LFQYWDHDRVDKYLFGRCPLFALALHNLYRYEIELFFVPLKNRGSQGSPIWISELAHAFCVRKDGSFVDARGSVGREQIIADYGAGDQNPRWERISKAGLLALITKCKETQPDNHEMFFLRQFLLQNQDVYKTGNRSIPPLRDVKDQFDLESISSQINSHNWSIMSARFALWKERQITDFDYYIILRCSC